METDALTALPPSPKDRAAAGRAARAETPRSVHSALDVAADRDPVALLEAQDASRLPELVPLRYARMLASPLAFFRGAAAVMANDLVVQPTTGLRAQLSGDAHLLNFGGFASAERNEVFDLNDFDETLSGPFEWDVKRLAASLEIAGRERGFTRSERSAVVRGAVRSYRHALRRFASMAELDVWYARLDADAILARLRKAHDAKLAKGVEQAVARARSDDGRRSLRTLIREVEGEPRIVSEPPLIVPLGELSEVEIDAEESIQALVQSYGQSLPLDRRTLLERFRLVDLARKVVGIGSVGTRTWIVLMLGRDEDDRVILQVKEAQRSVLEPLLGTAGFANQGERVVVGQRLLQASSDIFLGWTRAENGLDGPHDYYVRQLRDWKVSLDVETILPRGLADYAAACGWTLARGHARTGDRIAIASYLGAGEQFDRALDDFAGAYADLNERDHRALAQAVAEGRIAAWSTP